MGKRRKPQVDESEQTALDRIDMSRREIEAYAAKIPQMIMIPAPHTVRSYVKAMRRHLNIIEQHIDAASVEVMQRRSRQ